MKIRFILRLISTVCALLPAASVSGQYRTDLSYESLYDSETVTSFKEQVGFLSSALLEGRAPGSDGEKAAAEFVFEKLSSAGAEMLCGKSGDPFGISTENGDTLISRNVVGFVQGYDKELRNRYIVVGARLDNLGVNRMTVDGAPVDQIYCGANGNASGLAMLTELAAKVATNAVVFRRSVIFVAFGASTSSYAGAWYFINRSFSDIDKVDAMINLDMLGTGDNGFYAYSASNSDLDAIISALENELQPVRPAITAQEPYPSDHRAFYSKNIPSIMLTSGRYPEHNSPRDVSSIIDYEMMEKELEYSYNLTLALANVGTAPSFRPSEVPERKPLSDGAVSFGDCDIKPMFLNSPDPSQFLRKWVYQYLKYPQYALENGIQGRVLVDFIIEKDGSVSNVTVLRGVHQVLDEEAVKVVSASPKWRAGRVNGSKVRTAMTIPVEFRLEKKGGKGRFGIKK